MFQSARLNLTLAFAAVIMLITGSLSGLFYLRTARTLELEYERVEQRLIQQWHILQVLPPAGREILEADLRLAKKQVAVHLLVINATILAIVMIASYYLSGQVLQPIEEVHEEQKRFIGDAAHELRTPLTALKTSLEVNLMDNQLSKETKKYLQENLTDVTNLGNLIEGLLKLARVSDQRLQFEPLSLATIIHTAVDQVQPLARAKHIKLTIPSINPSLKTPGDFSMLVDSVVIILDNAIKYSPPKSIVTLSVKSTKKSICLSITDQGFGIDSKHLPHIFDRFYRVNQARTHTDSGGYGLGLAIAQKIITEHFGHIAVVSELDKGTTFTIHLLRESPPNKLKS